MKSKSIQLDDLVVTIDDISLVLNGQILCRFRVSHKNDPSVTLAELYGELTESGQLSVVCKTPLTPRRMEVLARFLHLYEANIVKFLRDNTVGMTPYMFKVPMG